MGQECMSPGSNQCVLYNRHKRVYAIKFQSIVAPNGMIANLYGPVESKRQSIDVLAIPDLPTQLQLHTRTPDGNHLCLYGDPAYPLRILLQSLFKLNLDQKQHTFLAI